MRYWFIIIFVIAFIFYNTDFDSSLAEVVFFNVGQGDAFLLRTPGGLNILVDGGPDWSVLYGLGRYLKNHQNNLDLLILSHSHGDHVSALPELIERYGVKKVFLPLNLSGDESLSLLVELAAQNIDIVYPEFNFCLNLENSCQLCFYPPSKNFLNSDDLNDFSLAFKFNCAGLSLAASGDASGQREQELITQGFPGNVQILKAAHHGSASANSDNFLSLANPLVLLISVGLNNYGHPDPKLINRSQSKGIKICRTDQLGDVLFYSKNSQLFSVKPW